MLSSLPMTKPTPSKTDEQGGMSLGDFNAGLRVSLTTLLPPVQRKFKAKPNQKPENPSNS